MFIYKTILLTLILSTSILYGCSCSNESTQTRSGNNDSIDTTAIAIDSISLPDSIVSDSILPDSTDIDTITTDNIDEQYFEPSTVADDTKKNIKQQLIALNRLIDETTYSLANDSISRDEASKIGQTIISTVDSIAKESKASEFKNQIKTVTRRANKLIDSASPSIENQTN